MAEAYFGKHEIISLEEERLKYYQMRRKRLGLFGEHSGIDVKRARIENPSVPTNSYNTRDPSVARQFIEKPLVPTTKFYNAGDPADAAPNSGPRVCEDNGGGNDPDDIDKIITETVEKCMLEVLDEIQKCICPKCKSVFAESSNNACKDCGKTHPPVPANLCNCGDPPAAADDDPNSGQTSPSGNNGDGGDPDGVDKIITETVEKCLLELLDEVQKCLCPECKSVFAALMSPDAESSNDCKDCGKTHPPK